MGARVPSLASSLRGCLLSLSHHGPAWVCSEASLAAFGGASFLMIALLANAPKSHGEQWVIRQPPFIVPAGFGVAPVRAAEAGGRGCISRDEDKKDGALPK